MGSGDDLPPRGRLLVWIDDLFAKPAMMFDRTFGRWNNAVQTAHAIPPIVRSRVHFLAFDRYAIVRDAGHAPTPTPQRHGASSSCSDWRPEFFDPFDPATALQNIDPLVRLMRQLQAARK